VASNHLLERGAAINQAKNDGATPLSIGCLNGHEPVARLLLEHGAAINQAKNDGATPLSIGCLNGHEPVALHSVRAST
jgi:ankyrin repeat protein